MLGTAVELGVSFLDTAPAYGASEDRLGAFLRGLGTRSRPMIATKFGEFWSADRGGWSDHSLTAAERSIRASAAKLGQIDLLQVHKATRQLVTDGALLDFAEGIAAELGIAHLGVSAKDVPTCEAAVATGRFEYLQCPINPGCPELAAWAMAHSREIRVVGNRPYGSGSLLASGWSMRDLLRFAIDHVGDGVVLTGTTNGAHLRQTHSAFMAENG